MVIKGGCEKPSSAEASTAGWRDAPPPFVATSCGLALETGRPPMRVVKTSGMTQIWILRIAEAHHRRANAFGDEMRRHGIHNEVSMARKGRIRHLKRSSPRARGFANIDAARNYVRRTHAQARACTLIAVPCEDELGGETAKIAKIISLRRSSPRALRTPRDGASVARWWRFGSRLTRTPSRARELLLAGRPAAARLAFCCVRLYVLKDSLHDATVSGPAN